ncbi:hypothetical protein PAEPH01_2013 [Pancytospora epiphaga]|nr:hypothetical protein PAEPH01_2013 [Pancytospora epiphaga]
MFFNSNVRVLLEEFILFGHISGSMPGMPNMVGFIGESSSDGLHTQLYNSTKNSFTASRGVGKGRKFVNVIPIEYSKDDHYYLASALLSGGSFSNIIYGSNNEEIHLPKSSASPFLVSNPLNMEPLIVIPKQNKLKFYSLKNKRLIENKEYEINTTVHSSGSSSFIDLSGDLRPNLVLHTNKVDGNSIEIYDFTRNSRKMIQRLVVSGATGPFLYCDLFNRICHDLIYISTEDGASYINVYINRHAPDLNQFETSPWESLENFKSNEAIFSTIPEFRLNISDVLTGTPILNDRNGMPTGLFIADLESNGEAHLIILMNDWGTAVARCVKLTMDGQVKLSPYDKVLGEYRDVLSVSVSDLYGRGKEDFIINYIKDGVPTLVYHKVNFPIQNSKLSALTVWGGTKDKMAYLPGVSYLMLYDDGKGWRKASQFSSTSYPSYQHQGSFIGLGQTNFFMTFVMAKTNGKFSKYDKRLIRNIIVPNTSIVLSASSCSEWRVRNYFLLNRYYVVTVSLLMLMGGNVFILFYLIIKERCLVMKKQTEKNLSKSLFPAL